MHSMCITKIMFVFELFIIMIKQPLYQLLTIESGSYDQTFVDQTKEIESDCRHLWNASLLSGWRSLKLLSVTKGKFDI